MSERPWRIVFLSQVPTAVARFHEQAKARGHEPVAVITTRPRAHPDAAARFAAFGTDSPPDLDVLVPASRERLSWMLRVLEPDLAVCMGFNWLIPDEVIAIPRLGIVNGHPSLLPRNRGPMPFAWAFRDGGREIGMTYHFMDASYDTGPVLAQGSVPIEDDDWFEELMPKLAVLSAGLVDEVFHRLERGERGDPQDDSLATWAGFFEDDYLPVDFSRSAREIHNQVRAWHFAMPMLHRGPIAELDGIPTRLLRTSLTRVDGGRELEAADGPIWIVASEPVES